MSWNYRVIKTFCKETGEDSYGIHEVYYDEPDEPVNATINPIRISSESIDDLRWMLDKFKVALEKPVLDMKEFNNNDKE